MKRLVPILLLAAGAACADPHGSFSFGIGPNNDATNSNYTTTIGYSAGSEARSDTRDFIGGTFAGAMSYNIKRSVGLGYGSFYMASNVTDCVAIGDRAGARWRNATGWVQVGDAFVFTNGYLNIGNGLIKGSAQGMSVAGLSLGDYVPYTNATQNVDLGGHALYADYVRITGGGKGGLQFGEGGPWLVFNGGEAILCTQAIKVNSSDDPGGSMISSSTVSASEVKTDKLTLVNQGAYTAALVYEGSGQIAVYQDGMRIGYLTITQGP